MIELSVLLPQHVALSLREAVPTWDRLSVPLALCAGERPAAGPALADYGDQLLRGLWHSIPAQVTVDLHASVSAGVVVCSVSGAGALLNKLTKFPGWQAHARSAEAHKAVRPAKFSWMTNLFVLSSDNSIHSYSFSRASQRLTRMTGEQLTNAPFNRAPAVVPGPEIALNESNPSFESYDRSYDQPTTNTPAGTPGPALQTFPRTRR